MNMLTFMYPSEFSKIPIGGQFIEVFSPSNEVATKIKAIVRKHRLVNARRTNGIYIIMWDWEPVFIEKPKNETDKQQQLHDDLREVWAIVTDQPGISLRAIADQMGIKLRRSRELVNMLLASGTLTADISKQRRRHGTLRATVPMITMGERK